MIFFRDKNLHDYLHNYNYYNEGHRKNRNKSDLKLDW